MTELKTKTKSELLNKDQKTFNNVWDTTERRLIDTK